MSSFRIVPSGFELDGRPLRVLSGALHYFRVLPEQWPHRLRMVRALGLNCVETYVPWNLHEPRPGRFDFTGIADVEAFLTASAEAGLYAIVRPSPYICAEWENGGLPWWLLADREVRLRVSDAAYLAHVRRWYDELLPRLAAHQITRGGNVLMMQVENEYGSYGSDTAYLERLRTMMRERGVDVPLFTSDGPEDAPLTGGSLTGAVATVNFGNHPEDAFAELARLRPDDPPMCMEFWCGWFDHWGEKRALRDPRDAADTLRRILDLGASVNIYMAHGGTSFGTWAGANRGGPAHDGPYQPMVTSYDYDAPIDERGAPTPKFWAFREVLTGFAEAAPPEPEQLPALLPPSRVELTDAVRLFDLLDAIATPAVHSPVPPSFEDLGLAHGLAHYEAHVPGPRTEYPLVLEGLADRAHVYLDGQPLAVLERDEEDDLPQISVGSSGTRLELLVESMGRVDYGPRLGDRKGLAAVRHGQQYVHGWTVRTVPLGGPLPDLPWGASAAGTTGQRPGPVFYRAGLEVTEPGDAYLAVPGGAKGYVWVNGFCLGRYWERGPQRTLYLPWPLLRPGRNEIVVLELDGLRDRFVEIRDEPDLD
ncbi:glycoside hydrolase family 35 protein [Streptomyces sp. RPT161]|uniref:glycoside hydrolase family 35 protein n=1 Tax=Streptomyces sp. RPT161 TaxID=3015993 RepID=UPI0022B86B62|nr:glycoside hydrolase family 35 protein [Streptomyces sp. RPT161]